MTHGHIQSESIALSILLDFKLPPSGEMMLSLRESDCTCSSNGVRGLLAVALTRGLWRGKHTRPHRMPGRKSVPTFLRAV